MTSLSDILTLGLVLVLLFGAISLYLYTRIQQAEQKISLLESILLDIKMSMEVKSYAELPADDVVVEQPDSYAPFNDDNDEEESAPVVPVVPVVPVKPASPTPSVSHNDEDNEVEQYKSAIAEAVQDNEVSSTDDTNPLEQVESIPSSKVSINYESASVNYESLTLKELQSLAKSRGIIGAGSMKKNSIIEALKTSDRVVPGPGSIGSGNNSFLETSATFGEESQ